MDRNSDRSLKDILMKKFITIPFLFFAAACSWMGLSPGIEEEVINDPAKIAPRIVDAPPQKKGFFCRKSSVSRLQNYRDKR